MVKKSLHYLCVLIAGALWSVALLLQKLADEC